MLTSGKGPVLAILAVLARKSALRVAPGGSAPLIPSVARRALAALGRDGKTGSPIEQESRFGSRGERRGPPQSIDKLTWRREHSGEAMLDPLGSIPG